MTIVLYPYKMGSKSGKTLAGALGAKRVYPDRKYKPKRTHLIVNWGSSTCPNWRGIMLNTPHNVGNACNKAKTLNILFRQGMEEIPEFTDSTEVAQQWIDNGFQVFGRQTLTGHSGNGIIIFDSETITTDKECPLYTKAVKKDKEYRVHVFNGTVIDYQQKKKRLGHEGGITGIRNFANGWIYARNEVELPEDVKAASIKAVNLLGLDFGAVDVCSVKGGGVCIFEVNTACGLEGTTIDKYVEAIRSYYGTQNW